MCGICGIYDFKKSKADKSSLIKMMTLMKHRGPDDESYFLDDNIALGFVRLSILDLSVNGRQPMFDESKRYSIVFNGEIYNFIEIREQLISKGFKFISNTDTEVVLKAFLHWGESCINYFNGMWAFCIYDCFEKSFFISRDRYGIKPFYYFKSDEIFIFASEIPPIHSIIKEKLKPNYSMIFDYLAYNRTDHTCNTFFDGVQKLEAGSNIKINLESFKIIKWYNLKERTDNAGGFADKDEFLETLISSVKLRLRSDVPIGVCLSGGLDSSSIVSVLLNKFNLREINTFSAIYGDGLKGDEQKYINIYNDSLQNMHFTYPDGNDLLGEVDVFTKAIGEPVPSTAPFAQFKVMELAKNYVKVTLDGQGADENLAGYHYFFGNYYYELLTNFKIYSLISEILRYIKIHKSLYALKSFLYLFLPDFIKSKYHNNSYNILNNSFYNQFIDSSNVIKVIYDSRNLNTALLNHIQYKLEHLLKWEDRNSMWHSIEARVPFLDYRLVENLLKSPSNFKIKEGKTKYILREAMNGILPEVIKNRMDKIGFETPARDWFKNKSYIEYINTILNESAFLRDIVDINKAKNYFKLHLINKVDINKDLWKWINLNSWFNLYFKN